MSGKVVAAILAAGSSSRFGSPKQLAKIGSKTLIDLALESLNKAGIEHICVVLGCNFETITDYLNEQKNSTGITFQIVQNPDWKNGVSTSIHTATKFAISASATHLLLLACDQPFVTPALIKSLLELAIKSSTDDPNVLARNMDNPIVACKYENSAGIPAIFPANYFDELLKIEGDKGAKSVILRSAAPVLLDFPNGAHDIDQPDDLTNCALKITSI